MKPTMLVALVGLALAAVDFLGLAQRVEAWIRALMVRLFDWGCWLFQKASDAWNYVTFGLVAIAGVIFAIVAYEWLTGVEVVGGLAGWTHSTSPVKKLVDDIVGTAYALVFLVLAASVAALVTWAVFWLLAWPKRGIVSSLGLLIAVVGVGLELVA
jgi:hypothetical protein